MGDIILLLIRLSGVWEIIDNPVGKRFLFFSPNADSIEMFKYWF